MALRFDNGSLGAIERTPQGGVRVPANLARVGVLKYSDGAGKEWSELVPEAEAFRDDSLASLADAPVTNRHPAQLVTTRTYREVNIGTARPDARRDGAFVAATLVVQDADAVAAIERRELREVSCGYTCDIEPTPGEYQGQRYDAIQRNRRYNHIALGPAGWGRAGGEVALRMDASASPAAQGSVGYAVGPLEAPTTTKTNPTVARTDAAATEHQTTMATKKITVGKRAFDVRTDDDMAPVQGAIDDQAKADTDAAASLQALCDATQKALADAMQQNAQLKGQLMAAQATAAQPPAITEDMVPDDVLDAAAAKRESLRADARKVLGPDAKLDGKKPAEVKREVIAKAFPSVKLDAVDAKAVDVLFRAAVDHAPKTEAKNDALDATRRAVVDPQTNPRTDARQDEVRTDGTLDEAQASLTERLMRAGREPLSAQHGKGA